MALGNYVGSNISNIGLVLASSSFVFYYLLSTDVQPNADSNKDSYVMLFAVILLIILAQDHRINFVEGFVFFMLYVIYLVSLYYRSRNKSVDSDSDELTSYVFLIGGLVAMLFGAQITVNSAVEVASHLGVSEMVIGLSVVAVGTSLPELASTFLTRLLSGSAMYRFLSSSTAIYAIFDSGSS